MRIGVPREIRQGETMVAATPKTVTQLIGLGYEVVVEHGAGERAHFPDAAFAAAGAFVEPVEEVWKSDVILKVYEPMGEEFHRMHRGQNVISIMAPARNEELIQQLSHHGVTGLALDAVPRISRAQSLDVLSSQANVAGYRAVVEAAHAYGSLFNGQVTAAGKVPPATVFVIGAGVAGLAAIGTAGSLGAIVKATDVRPEVAEQVQSGAQPRATSADFTLTLLVMVVLGGVGSRVGAVIGAVLYTLLDQRLGTLASSPFVESLPPFLHIPLSEPLFILGTLFILVVLFLPGGLSGALNPFTSRRTERTDPREALEEVV